MSALTGARAARLGIAAVALACGALSLSYLVGTLAPPHVLAKDFGQSYLLARATHDGVDPYAPIRELADRYTAPVGLMDKSHPTPHPPTLGVLFLPLALLPYEEAAIAWFVVELVCLFAAVPMLARGVGLNLRARQIPIVGLIGVGWPAVILDLSLGQLMTPILACLAAAHLMLIRGRSDVGGALFGLTLLLKPIAWPWFLVLAACRDWRAVLSAVVVVVSGYLLSGFVIGLERLVTYVTVVVPTVSASMSGEPTNISLWVVAPRVFGATQAPVATLLPATTAILITGWILMRPPPLTAAVCAATALSTVLSPIAWLFYLVIAALPVSYVAAMTARRRFKPLEVVAVFSVGSVLVVPYHVWLLVADTSGSDHVLFGPTIAMLVLALLVAHVGGGNPSVADKPQSRVLEARHIQPQ